MTHPRLAQKSSGGKGFCSVSAFVPAKSGGDLFAEGAPLSACDTDQQACEWLAAEDAMIAEYLAAEAAKKAAQVADFRRRIAASYFAAKARRAKADDMKGALAWLKACQMEGVPAATALSVFC